MNTQPSACQEASAYKQALTQALADLAAIEEQREGAKQRVAAIRNYLNGIALGQRVASELAALEASCQKDAQPEVPAAE